MSCFHRFSLAIPFVLAGLLALQAEEPGQTMIHGAAINAIAISPDGKLVASVGDDRIVRLWQMESGGELHCLKGHRRAVTGVAFSPDGKTLATACHGGTIRLWSLETGKLLHSWRAHEKAILCLAWSPDGSTLATGSEDCTLVIWDANSKQRRQTIQEHQDSNHPCPWVETVVFSPDGTLLCTGCHDNSIRIFNAATGQQQQRWDGEAGVVAVRMSPDGLRVASLGYRDRQVSIGTLGSTNVQRIVHRAGNLGLAFSPDGKTLATGGNDGRVYLWDSSSGKQLARFRVHEKLVSCLAFTPNGNRLVTSGHDGGVKVWDWKDKLRVAVSADATK